MNLAVAFAAVVTATAVVLATAHVAADGAPEAPPSFCNEVVRILQRRCQSCHHDGDIAPFPLVTYSDAAPRAEMIRNSTAARAMPPWNTRPGCAEIDRDPRLADAEIETLSRWADAGAPEGDSADLPAPLEFAAGWRLGEPDAVFANSPDGFLVPQDEDEVIRCFSVPTRFRTDRYVTAVEVRPGTRATVHHVLVFLDARGTAARFDRADQGPGYACFGAEGVDMDLISGWNPGADPVQFPEGTAFRIPAGARLVVQIHYSDGYAGQVDRTLVGLHFARSPVSRRVASMLVQNVDFTIPAGDPDRVLTATKVLSKDVTVGSVRPHMHYLGARIDVDAIVPGGGRLCLLGLDWDVHWQRTYALKAPARLPAGTTIVVTGHFDNTAANPHNPNSPPRDVRRGRNSYDEMLFANLEFTRDAERLAPSAPSLSSVRVVAGRLVIEGTGFRRGAAVEVDGRLLADSRRARRGRVCSSSKSWLERIRPGEPVTVAVVNPDGGRTSSSGFVY